MATELQVIIATFGRPALLEQTLSSLAACHKPSIYNGIVVVENGSRDGVEQIVNSCPQDLRARYMFVEQGNKSNALNEALRELSDECLVFFADDDIQFSQNLLQHYANAAEGINGGIFFGGPTEVEYEKKPPDWLIPYLPASARGWRPDRAKMDPKTMKFLGFNWAAFVSDLRRAGLFDTTIGPGGTSYGVGQDWQMQIDLHGINVHALYLPDATVRHYVPVERCTTEWTKKRAFRNGIRSGILLRNSRGIHMLKMFRRLMICAFSGTAGYAVTRLCWAPHARFWAEYNLHNLRGWIKGALYAH